MIGLKYGVAISVAGLLGGSLVFQPAQGQSLVAPKPTTPRGIFLGGTKLGVSAEVEIERGNQHGMVPTTFEFRTGDRFWLYVTVNQDAYVYVINRTLRGTPEQVSRGVKLMADSDRRNAPAQAYTLVFPAPGTANRLLKAGNTTKLPGAAGQYFGMDEDEGAEKLLVIASAKPLPLSTAYFNGQQGSMTLASAKVVDSSGTVLGRLNDDLVQIAGNTESQEPPKTRSIAIVPNPFQSASSSKQKTEEIKKKANDPKKTEDAKTIPPHPPNAPPAAIAIAKQSGQPLLLDLTLLHLRSAK